MEANRQHIEISTGNTAAAPESTLNPSATRLVPEDCTTTTPNEIQLILEKIDMDIVEKYFLDEESKGDEMDGCAPYLVAENVSKEAFYEYYNKTMDDPLPFSLRFLELSGGSLWIVELPHSTVHERTSRGFDRIFMRALGQAEQYVWTLGHPTIEVVPGETREADEMFGPNSNEPGTIPPESVEEDKWFTLVVEVGRMQQWSSLQVKALGWYEYPGIQYILLLKVSETAFLMSYELYDLAMNPLAQNPTALPVVPRVELLYDPNGGPQQLISLDTRRILGIPPGQPLPNGVANVTNVNLRDVMRYVLKFRVV